MKEEEEREKNRKDGVKGGSGDDGGYGVVKGKEKVTEKEKNYEGGWRKKEDQ